MADELFGFLITWTTYGTWLPGDERGHVSDVIRPNGTRIKKVNTPGLPYARGDAFTRHLAIKRQIHPTFRLSTKLALKVAESLVSAAKQRGWRILRGALMANHIHLVLIDCPADGPVVRRILKGVSQTDLCKETGIQRRWWTQRGSDRYLNGDFAIEGAIEYVANQEYKLVEIIDMKVIAARG